MIEIELEATAECYNPSCGAEISPPSGRARYCPRCGAPQVFECEACPSRPGGLIRVAKDSDCPRCGAVYVVCAKCYHPVLATPDRPMACPEGCAAGFREARTGACEPLANLQRTGCVPCEPSVAELTAPKVWQMRDAITTPVCRFGRIYFGTARGTIRAISEDTGEDLETWQQTALFNPDAVALHDVSLQVSRRYVYFAQARGIKACSVVDGAPCFELEVETAHSECAILNDRLLLCSVVEDVLKLELHDTVALCEGRGSLLLEQQAQCRARDLRQPVTLPAASDQSFLVRDLDGNILEIPATGEEELRTLWKNEEFEYVSPPAVRGRHAYLLVHDIDFGGRTTVVRLGLDDRSKTETRLPGIRPAYIGLRVCAENVYLFGGDRDFYELNRRALSAPPRPIFYGAELTGDTVMDTFLALEGREVGGVWLLSLSGTPGNLLPRMVHSETQVRPTLAKPEDGPVALAASDTHIFVTAPGTGEMLVYDIPEH